MNDIKIWMVPIRFKMERNLFFWDMDDSVIVAAVVVVVAVVVVAVAVAVAVSENTLFVLVLVLLSLLLFLVLSPLLVVLRSVAVGLGQLIVRLKVELRSS